MKRSLVIGNTNVGKTLFCIRFAKYVGLRQLRWFVERTDGKTEQQSMPLDDAVKWLSSSDAHHTRALQTLVLEVPRGKSNRQLLLTDATGLTEGIHNDPAVREAMAQTLGALTSAHMVLHVVDASRVGTLEKTGDNRSTGSGWLPVDDQLSQYGMQNGGYLILANKMDLPGAKQGYQQLVKRFSKHRVIPVSALTGSGFREVKHHVWRFA